MLCYDRFLCVVCKQCVGVNLCIAPKIVTVKTEKTFKVLHVVFGLLSSPAVVSSLVKSTPGC